MRTVLVTGATGFVGHYVTAQLLLKGFSVRGTLLQSEDCASLVAGVDPVSVEPLGPLTPWQHVLGGVDTVIHLAARVHIMDDRATDPLTEFRRINAEGTARLAREAAGAGVRRIVFISSIKVNGDESIVPLTEDSPVSPSGPYGVSKFEAEEMVRQIGAETGLEVVIIRPPLVYGPGVKANFLNLMRIVKSGIPLPLASIKNLRSLIFVKNLADALVCCAVQPAAAGRSYLVSDGDVVSTPELIQRVAAAMGVPPRLFSVPVSFMQLGGTLTGKRAAVDRLVKSLVVDDSDIRNELGWIRPFTMDEGLRETTKWFLEQGR